jgi:hypothetical protein
MNSTITRTLDAGASLFSPAEIRVVSLDHLFNSLFIFQTFQNSLKLVSHQTVLISQALIPVGPISEDAFTAYAKLISRHHCLELANVQSFYKEAQKSPFKYFPWKTGHMHFRFLNYSSSEGKADNISRDSSKVPSSSSATIIQQQQRSPDLLRAFQAHRNILGVIGIMHCPSIQDIPATYQEFEKQRAKLYPEACTFRCFAFDPADDQVLQDHNLVASSQTNFIMFPPGDGEHLAHHAEVVMHDFGACLLAELERWMLTASPGAMELHGFIDSVEFNTAGAVVDSSGNSSSVLSLNTSTISSSSSNNIAAGSNTATNAATNAISTTPTTAVVTTSNAATVAPSSSMTISSSSTSSSSSQSETNEMKTKRRYVRLQKLFGDYSLLAGSPLDAQEHYSTAADLARTVGDLVYLSGALEGYAASLALHAATKHDGFGRDVNSVFNDEGRWRSATPHSGSGGGGSSASPATGSGGKAKKKKKKKERSMDETGDGAAEVGSNAPPPTPPQSSPFASSQQRVEGGGAGGGDAPPSTPPVPDENDTHNSSDNEDDDDADLQLSEFKKPKLWDALTKSGIETEIIALYNDSKAALRRRGTLPLLVESDLKLSTFLGSLHGSKARGRVTDLVAGVQIMTGSLPLSEDRLIAYLDAAVALDAVGCHRKQVLLLWQAAEMLKMFQLGVGGVQGCPAAGVARVALEEACLGYRGIRNSTSSSSSTEEGTTTISSSKSSGNDSDSIKQSSRRWWPHVKAGCLESLLGLAISTKQHSQVWDASAKLLRKHSFELNSHRMQSLLENLSAAASHMNIQPKEKVRAGAGPPPLIYLIGAKPLVADAAPARLFMMMGGGDSNGGDGGGQGGSPGGKKGPFLYDPFTEKRKKQQQEQQQQLLKKGQRSSSFSFLRDSQLASKSSKHLGNNNSTTSKSKDASQGNGTSKTTKATTIIQQHDTGHNDDGDDDLIEWVCGELAVVDIEVSNPSSVAIKIDRMTLEVDFHPLIGYNDNDDNNDAVAAATSNGENGVINSNKQRQQEQCWKAQPVSLNIPAHTKPVKIQLEGTPLLAGRFTLVGCKLTGLGGVTWHQPWSRRPLCLAEQLSQPQALYITAPSSLSPGMKQGNSCGSKKALLLTSSSSMSSLTSLKRQYQHRHANNNEYSKDDDDDSDGEDGEVVAVLPPLPKLEASLSAQASITADADADDNGGLGLYVPLSSPTSKIISSSSSSSSTTTTTTTKTHHSSVATMRLLQGQSFSASLVLTNTGKVPIDKVHITLATPPPPTTNGVRRSGNNTIPKIKVVADTLFLNSVLPLSPGHCVGVPITVTADVRHGHVAEDSSLHEFHLEYSSNCSNNNNNNNNNNNDDDDDGVLLLGRKASIQYRVCVVPAVHVTQVAFKDMYIQPTDDGVDSSTRAMAMLVTLANRGHWPLQTWLSSSLTPGTEGEDGLRTNKKNNSTVPPPPRLSSISSLTAPLSVYIEPGRRATVGYIIPTDAQHHQLAELEEKLKKTLIFDDLFSVAPRVAPHNQHQHQRQMHTGMSSLIDQQRQVAAEYLASSISAWYALIDNNTMMVQEEEEEEEEERNGVANKMDNTLISGRVPVAAGEVYNGLTADVLSQLVTPTVHVTITTATDDGSTIGEDGGEEGVSKMVVMTPIAAASSIIPPPPPSSMLMPTVAAAAAAAIVASPSVPAITISTGHSIKLTFKLEAIAASMPSPQHHQQQLVVSVSGDLSCIPVLSCTSDNYHHDTHLQQMNTAAASWAGQHSGLNFDIRLDKGRKEIIREVGICVLVPGVYQIGMSRVDAVIRSATEEENTQKSVLIRVDPCFLKAE